MSRISLHTGPIVVLATTYKEYKAALRKFQVQDLGEDWLSPGAEATHHYELTIEGYRICIVCMPIPEEVCEVRVASTLVHEAVHVWQTHKEDIGEKSPGREFEAYAIQNITEKLLTEFLTKARREK